MTNLERLFSTIEEQPLSRGLTASLKIATSIKDDELVRWIKLEIMGLFHDNPAMTETTVVPKYRSVPGQWHDEYGRPLVLSDPNLGFVNEVRLRHGVAELEGLVSSSNMLTMRLPEFSDIIRQNLHVDVSLFQFRPSSVSQVLANIKVHLLDQLALRRESINSLPSNTPHNTPEILQLKPGLYGISVDLKALWRRLFK